jgi:hypothetical protein
VEITGTINPQEQEIRNALARFEWKQSLKVVVCAWQWGTGGWDAMTEVRDESKESPDPNRAQTHETVNWKVFTMDSPGMKNLGWADWSFVEVYMNLETRLLFNGKPVRQAGTPGSDVFKWSYRGTFLSDGQSYLESQSGQSVQVGHVSMPPMIPDPADPGKMIPDCDHQP